jgi:hypothetical protein
LQRTAETRSAPRGDEQRRVQAGEWPWITASGGKLVQALLFGVAFGFLLQKGGVAKFDILIGVLLLENFIVVQVMLSAIVVGMIGTYILERMGVLEYQIRETVFGTNIVGGVLFGLGFGLIAYCPGTDAAAVGQGNLDALVGIVGMAAGSYLFAVSSRYTSRTIGAWGQCGKLTLPKLLGISHGASVAIAVPVLVVILILLEVLM